MPRVKLTKTVIDARPHAIERHRLLGYRVPRLRRQGYAEAAQGFRRIVSNGGGRVALT